ncbi:restriction endonuclease subunit S [Enterococcus sp. FR008]|uniref:restriction endonuclease subunit S n=1 Tax=Enterococcus TaxID=1350 RepID=UPI00207307C0|nr:MULTISPECIES: restriction endonuclease subunit S [Enterococcus]MDQ8621756.1 restriction endonuclease subunit S [Enterococcus sp. FR008]
MSKKSPQLRFKGFTDDWEERKLGEVGYFYYGKSAPKWSVTEDAETPCVRYGELYTKYGAKISNIYSHTNINPKNLKFSTGNEVLVPRVGENPLDFSLCSWLSIPNVAIGEMISVYNTNENPLFISYYFRSQMKYEFAKRVEGGNVSNLYYSYLEDIDLYIPKLEEQIAISKFFEKLDDTIALHQRKLDLLKEQKKGYLQKMFPKNGAKVPELRFAGFADDWEERKLKELGDIQTGNTPPTSDSDNYSLDGVLWVTPTDIKSLVISNTAKKLSQVGVTKARIAKAGSILVTSIASIGKNTLLRMDAGFNQQINSLTPTSENDSYFLLTQSEKWSEKMKQTAASATMQIVNKTDFSNISTYVPVHKEEQEKIGSFFKQLDDTIALHQRKLDLLKEQKKGFLQKMFV